MSEGLMGCGPDGASLEQDPSDSAPGVSLLLGRMPNAIIRPFCDLPVSRQTARQAAGRQTGTGRRSMRQRTSHTVFIR